MTLRSPTRLCAPREHPRRAKAGCRLRRETAALPAGQRAHIRAIYESAVERQFSTAAINTIISIARKGKPDDSAETEFVQLQEEFDKATAPGGKRRVISKTAAQLRAAGIDPAKRGDAYAGDKWGGKYLRAPDIYHHILDKYGDRLIRLGDIAAIRRGVTTGANNFFYLTPAKIREFGIEAEYYAPVMTSPTESRALLVDAAALPKRLFMCHAEKSELAGTGALRYIEWGESQGFHLRPSTRVRPRWYDLGEREPPPIAMNRIIDQRARAFTLRDETRVGNTLYEVHCEPDAVEPLADALNDDFAQIQYNIEGRSNFGGGALEHTIYETENVLTPNPNIHTGGGIAFTPEEREALREGLRVLVNNRRLRARNY